MLTVDDIETADPRRWLEYWPDEWICWVCRMLPVSRWAVHRRPRLRITGIEEARP